MVCAPEVRDPVNQMMIPSWLWAAFTITAAGAQTLRNAMQRDLIASLGTGGATYVRFLFGLPFAVLFLVLVAIATQEMPPLPGAGALAFTLIAAVSQIFATALMLAAMRERAFVVAIAYTKTEPVLVALFGLIVLGDRLSAASALAILVATSGVMLMSWPHSRADEAYSWRPAAYGLVSAAAFALSAVGYRAAILALNLKNFIVAASTILACGLAIQTALILVYLTLFDRALLGAILRLWRESMTAGFMGALASQFWYLAFAIDTAARVRTLALVEMIFAQIATRRLFRQETSRRELAGMAMIIAGVVLLLWG
jgi:drug/metabolite transporter (DMT)-like permease